MYVCLSPSLSACLSVCLSVCLTDSMSVCLYRCHSLDTAFRAQPGLTSSRLGLAQPVLACTGSARLGNPWSIFASPLGFRLINDQLSCGKSQKDRQYRFPLQFFYTSRTVLKKAIDEYRNPGTWPALKSMFCIQTVMRATHANAESFKPGHPP